MAFQSDFKMGRIVGVGMPGNSVTKPAELFGVASTVWKEMTAFEKEGKKPHRSKTLEES